MMMEDYIVRASAANDKVRAFAIYSKQVVETARQMHSSTPVVSAGLGRALSAGLMMGCMMKGEKDLLTLSFKGDGPAKCYLVTADSMGHVKGYPGVADVELPLKSNGKLDVGGSLGNGTLTVIKDMGLKEPYSGSCALVNGEIAEDLTYYFVASEQVPSSVGLGVLVAPDGSVMQAGGFIIQLMPGEGGNDNGDGENGDENGGDSVIDIIENNLKNITSVTDMLNAGLTPENILEKVLSGLDIHVLEKIPVAYKCDCSRERVTSALATISKDDIRKMIEDDEPINVKCSFCNKEYEFTPEDLGKLL